MSEYTDLHNRIRALEVGGGMWHKIADPATGWLASKTTDWTADSFGGGLTVDFSAVVPVGTKAVRVVVYNTSAATGQVYTRKSGDTNISNTPEASSEFSHMAFGPYAGTRVQVVVWLSSDYKAQFAVTNISMDLYIAYPSEYLL